MPSCSSTTKSCGSTWRISRPAGSDTARAASIARRTSSRVTSRFLPATATTPRLLKPLMCGPLTPRCTEPISTPAISSASSIDFLIDSTAASRLTTTPRFSPLDSATPMPMMSRPPSSRDLADDGADLRRADVEPHDVPFLSCHAASSDASAVPAPMPRPSAPSGRPHVHAFVEPQVHVSIVGHALAQRAAQVEVVLQALDEIACRRAAAAPGRLQHHHRVARVGDVDLRDACRAVRPRAAAPRARAPPARARAVVHGPASRPAPRARPSMIGRSRSP